jgi:amino acid adenylation domain-containing protein/thioester reductase-like protein
VDLRECSEDEQETQLQKTIAEEIQQTFDLSKDALLRAKLIRLNSTEHRFLLVMHHIVTDAWSVEILFRELATFYRALLTEQPPAIADLPIQYADFAHWQRQWFQGEELATQLSYWKRQLGDNPPVLQLPTDYPRSAVQTYQGQRESIALSKTLTNKLKTLSQQEEATLFMTLLAAFKVLLYRYTGQEDIFVGSPIANRNQVEIEELIGFFINTLVLRTDLSGNPTFRELLQRVREVALEAYSHQDVPFEKIVAELQPERYLSHNPLFQTIFALQNAPSPAPDFLELDSSFLQIDTQTAKFEFQLELFEKLEGLEGWCEYNTTLFTSETINRMLGHFQVLLEAIVSNPDQRLSDLPLLTDAERHQLLVEWNNTKTDYPRNLSIHQLFEAQVEQTPNNVAVIFEDKQLSYQQLNQQANQLAHYLQSLGVKPGELVGICIERSLEMIIGVVGILKAGGAYIPLDPTYPQERLASMLEDSQVSVLLTQQQLIERLPHHHARVVCLDTDWQVINRESEDNLISNVAAHNLAYVIYTSGSTGKPKGVAVPHRGVVRLLINTNYVKFNPDDKVAHASNPSFDAATFEIWGALLHGARIIIVTKDILLSPQNFVTYIRAKEINVLFLTPALFHQLASFVPQAFSSLKYLVLGGEAVDPRWVKEVLEQGPPQQLLNGYGPTESTTFSCCYLIQDISKKSTNIPIGRPISNTQVYILDHYLQPVPIGVPGELYIGGDGLAQGYLNRPELNREKFIPNPLSEESGNLLYKTGDLVRYLPDGNIEFLGRTDNLVKIRGFRIELGEIEAVLAQHPVVEKAVVIAREDISGDKRLVAYIANNKKLSQSTDPKSQISNQLRDFLKQKLPDYMVPSIFVLLDTLPITSNGKVDRRALPDPDQSLSDLNLAEAFVAPRTSIEQQLAEIWAQILNLEQVSIYDDFFEFGGHSLLVTQLLFQVRETFQVVLPLQSFFKAPTIAELAKNIETIRNTSNLKVHSSVSFESLCAEAVLDPTIVPNNLSFQFTAEPTHILLTGATGFLGAFLLEKLLQKTQATIYCLVRSQDAGTARTRIQENLASYLLWNDSFASRITPVVGDLSQSLLGLSQEKFELLASEIDTIYHNGALANSNYSYSVLKKTNVLGTQEILRLASQMKLKSVHFVSSINVFPLDKDYGLQVIQEQDDSLNHGYELYDSYSQSKWVAENLILAARFRGIPCCIYRPVRIIGHSQTGAYNQNDFVYRMILGCIQLGIAPDCDTKLNLLPVDYITDAIVHLSKQKESLDKNFHLANSQLINWNDLISWIKMLGYPLEIVSYEQWCTNLLDIGKSSVKNFLYPLLPLFFEGLSKEQIFDSTELQFDCRNTNAGLLGTSITYPSINAEFFERALSTTKHLLLK